MNFLAFHFLHVEAMAKPEDEDTRRIHIRKHRGVSWVLFLETGEMIQIRFGCKGGITLQIVIADTTGEFAADRGNNPRPRSPPGQPAHGRTNDPYQPEPRLFFKDYANRTRKPSGHWRPGHALIIWRAIPSA